MPKIELFHCVVAIERCPYSCRLLKVEKPISKKSLAQEKQQQQQQQCVLDAQSCALKGKQYGGEEDANRVQSVVESAVVVGDGEGCSLKSAADATLSTNSRIK